MIQSNSYVFFGSSPQFVLIVAGIHTNEQSGVEVAHWIRVKLAAREKPTRLGAVVIPEVFPDRGLGARAAEWRAGKKGWMDAQPDEWREYKKNGQLLYPARHFPPPGMPLAALKRGLLVDRTGKGLLKDKDRRQIPLLPQMAYLIHLIETIQPVRIVSIHGKRRRGPEDVHDAAYGKNPSISKDDADSWDRHSAINGVNFAGIFVDPRYDPSGCKGFDLEGCKFDREADPAFPLLGDKASKRYDSAITPNGREDDDLARKAAQAVEDKSLVIGNHLNDKGKEVVHYAKEGGTPHAFSLGDWGPVVVKPEDYPVGARSGAPVFTIEVDQNHESWYFLDGVQVMDEGGKPLVQVPPPAERAAGRRGLPYVITPDHSNHIAIAEARSKQLRDYADAIIATILEL